MCKKSGGFWILESDQSTETLAVVGGFENEFVRYKPKLPPSRKVLGPGKNFKKEYMDLLFENANTKSLYKKWYETSMLPIYTPL